MKYQVVWIDRPQYQWSVVETATDKVLKTFSTAARARAFVRRLP